MATLVQVATLPAEAGDPLDLWGGVDGAGFDGRLYLTTGARHGGRSRVYSSLDGGTWGLELDSQAETINKIRDLDGILYAFYESPGEGETWLVSRPPGQGWTFEGVPGEGHTVGGRGIGARGGLPLVIGASHDWDGSRRGAVYQGAGVWSPVRSIEPSLMWELEYDGLGRLWEFWNNFDGSTTPATYLAGTQIADPPGANISHAGWFVEHMYIAGGLNEGGAPFIARSNGGAWETVFSFAQGVASHVVPVPRGAGELWAVAQGPFQVARTLDGNTWEAVTVPVPYVTGDDTNHLVALGYYKGRVFAASKDAEAGLIRILADGRVQGRSMVQVI